VFRAVVRAKLDRDLKSRQEKKDESFALCDRIVVKKFKRTEWLGIPILSDEEYAKKYYDD